MNGLNKISRCLWKSKQTENRFDFSYDTRFNKPFAASFLYIYFFLWFLTTKRIKTKPEKFYWKHNSIVSIASTSVGGTLYEHHYGKCLKMLQCKSDCCLLFNSFVSLPTFQLNWNELHSISLSSTHIY